MAFKSNCEGGVDVTRIGRDKPWRRPGRVAYAAHRWSAFRRPAVSVHPMPADVLKQQDVAVRMRDGVTLRLNLYRPAGPELALPVLLSAHPYGKDAVPVRRGRRWRINPQFRIMNQPAPVRISDQTSWEAPDPVWWVGQGYAVINMDVRGGGRSEGRGALFSDQEADDIGQRHVPAVQQPAPGRPGLGKHAGQRDAGRGTEPDHRAAEADGVGENAPVVASLRQCQRGEGDVVEYRRDEAQSHRRMP